MAGEIDELDSFYAALKSGTTVTNFLEWYGRIIQSIHEIGLTEDYRLAKGRVKKLCDEVTPVARFVRKHAAPEDGIWFALDDTVPDCCVKHEGGRVREIEVTVAQAKERHHVMIELNQTGIGRAHLGLSDDIPMAGFAQKMAEPRVAYCEDDIRESIIRALAICDRNKSRYKGDTLLIEAPLETLPAARWTRFAPLLAEGVKGSAFSEVYVTGRSGNDGICLRIK